MRKIPPVMQISQMGKLRPSLLRSCQAIPSPGAIHQECPIISVMGTFIHSTDISGGHTVPDLEPRFEKIEVAEVLCVPIGACSLDEGALCPELQS